MQLLPQLKADLKSLANPEKAKILSGFFKAGKGQYGEGDVFLGVMVPQQRLIAKKYSSLTLKDIKTLLSNKIHEYRMVALFILVNQFREADEAGKKQIAGFYLDNTRRINNWDLVDLSAPYILGEHLAENDTAILYRLAASDDLWKRRIAIIATFAFIRRNKFGDTLRIAEALLHDRHDLIHKAAGWMLREVGKRDVKTLEQFLGEHARAMPRTMLRYAIERFDEEKRRYWLTQKAGRETSAAVGRSS
jgi:3-methyladenine DNA glycosylase AlkD